MGQGYSLTTLSAGSAGIDVPELADLTYEKSLGDARFMKAIRARHRDGLVVAKVVMKPYASMEFSPYIAAINRERKLLADVPNALGYYRALETSSNGYLVRQYLYSSAYDRLSTRPFLEDIEKKWLAFQLLYAVRDCHAREVYHGDIKTENILVTSWNWLYLTDFSSSFKPTFLPEDNPADFSFFFDIAGRRTCYLAPERFLSPGQTSSGRKINWAMDIFSVGCVIAELFLETPVFNLSQLFNYRNGEYDPVQLHLSRIEDQDIRELISHMIQLEPESRYSADEYLNFWRGKVFPEYFYSFLHQYMFVITDPSSGRAPVTAGTVNLGESDDRIERVYQDYDKIAFFLGYEDTMTPSLNLSHDQVPQSLFPLHLDIPNKREVASGSRTPSTDDGTLLFVNIVTSALRSTARASARIRACELMLAFAQRMTNEAKLDRILPFVMSMIHDPTEVIQITALRTLTQLIDLVSVTSPINASIFPEYVLPRLEAFLPLTGRKPSALVRATYASCLGTLAQSAARFLDVSQAYKAEGSLTAFVEVSEDSNLAHAYQDLYDGARAELVRVFEVQTKALLTDSDANVRRAFLGSVSSLCIFFGSAKASDVILSHLNTYLNDRDWKLKCAFFDTIVGVAIYVGSANLEEFILPLMVQAVTDPEETVVEKVLRSLATMAQLGLFQRPKTWALIDMVARFTIHPNSWIREAAVYFVVSATKYISMADSHCIVRPLLKPYLRMMPDTLSETKLLEVLKKPLPRSVFDMAFTWAEKSSDGSFWKPAKQRTTFDLTEDRIAVTPAAELTAAAFNKFQKTSEDNQWITRLRNLGMSTEDEVKLLALREYVWRVAKRKTRESNQGNNSLFSTKISLKDVGVDLQTIFFDRRLTVWPDGPTDDDLDRGREFDETDEKLLSGSIADGSIHSFPDSPASPGSQISDVARPPKPTPHSQTQPSPLRPDAQRPKLRDTPSEDNPARLLRQAHRGILPASHHNHTVSRKGSAIDLMHRQSAVSKAEAEISTSQDNAIGQSYVRNSTKRQPRPTANTGLPRSNKGFKYQAAHTYAGRDPSVLTLLDTVYLDSYPVDLIEFGPIITPFAKHQTEQREGGLPVGPSKPNGTLVALFGEHTGSVNRIAVAPDHIFFITGSDDGCVKVWDCTRLERNIAHRSRQTYRLASGAKVTSLSFVEDTHCFICTGSDGSLHVVKVDCIESGQGITKYGKLRLLRQWQLPGPSSYAVWVQHFKSENHSIAMLATNTSQIMALDLNTMRVLYTLDNALSHGTPTCFCVDLENHWLLLGTSHGCLDLWDLRFRVCVRSWSFPGAFPIHRLSLQPKHEQHASGASSQRKAPEEGVPKIVLVAGGSGPNEVTVWDLNRVACLEVFRCATVGQAGTNTTPDTTPKSYTLQNLDPSSSDTFLERFAGNLSLESQTDRGVRAIASASAASSLPFLVTASADCKVRFWNLARISESCVVSGLEAEEGNPQYETQVAPLKPPTHVEKAVSRDVERERQRLEKLSTAGSISGAAAKDVKDTKEVIKPSRTTIISEQQARLLCNHLDVITDVAVLEYPCRMIVSVDRSGMIYVFS